MNNEKGFALIETLVAIAILGAVGVIFLSGLATAARATIVADEKTTAQSLLVSQLEWARKSTYEFEASEYSAAPIPAEADYTGYSATISAQPVDSPDRGVQKITIIIMSHGEPVITMDSYKVKRDAR
ncbi:MAG: type II secretion system protein [Chloroflexi bacterium]|nr:type II secretion system protein [Chloroflexota bacterium]